MTKRTALILALAMLSFSCRRPNQPTPAVSPPAVAPSDQGRPAALPTAPTGDLELLVGKWNIVPAVADGEGYTASYRRAKFEIAAGGKYMFALPGLVEETGTIYKLDGDDLMICLSMLGNRRPTDFVTTKDSWRVLMTCKRMKLADHPKGVTAKAPLPQTLPRDVQQAWVEAGAEVGWMGKTDDHVSLEFRTTPDALIDPVPAFRFKTWTVRTVARLPVPKTPFGLDLTGTEATDADMKGLEMLESLSALDLAFTTLTDVGLKNLSGLKCLTVLNLFATKVTDVGLKELASLNSLRTLDLRVLDITDVGLKELAGMRSLQCLDLADTRVTDTGVKELKQALPNCWIRD
ncbi:leucine-rich repeat domain-containing protein [Telmatocola sphagniphila]|nr:hypothetical protein [Telmatocola sphagniphila]